MDKRSHERAHALRPMLPGIVLQMMPHGKGPPDMWNIKYPYTIYWQHGPRATAIVFWP